MSDKETRTSGRKAHGFVIEPGETFTVDLGDKQIVITTPTPSATANAAIASLRTLSPSRERNQQIAVQSTLGEASSADLDWWTSQLASANTVVPSQFPRNVDRDALRTAVQIERENRRNAMATTREDRRARSEGLRYWVSLLAPHILPCIGILIIGVAAGAFGKDKLADWGVIDAPAGGMQSIGTPCALARAYRS
jgi:hypothetical protein